MYTNKYIDFEAYERIAEPHKREKASVWRTAIGLQDVDGLKVSDYLKQTAIRHIEGDITIDEVREQLRAYYINKTTHDEDDAEKEEADRVAANIAKLLGEKSFSLTALEVLNIHRHLFEGVFKHAGEVRPYDISKKEWILQGESVIYGRAADIHEALKYDIQQERDFSYSGLTYDQIIDHIVDFVSLLWQNHPFREGNTPTSTPISTPTSSKQVQAGVNQFDTDNENIKRLMLFVGNQKLSIKEMMVGVGLKDRKNFLAYSLKPAINDGWLRMLYPDSPRHPRQKSLLTIKGQGLYNKLRITDSQEQ